MIAASKNPRSLVCGVMVVLLVTALGLSLTLRGWKSRIPEFDVLLYIDNAHQFLANGKFPDKGTLTSFGSYAPPGITWLMLPGVFFFPDPRLYEYVGTAIFYSLTLLGIFLLARRFFGTACGILSLVLYGFSGIGIFFAGSLWPRGHPFFYVWMVYWTERWVTRGNANYLAAAIVTWAMGMYVFMEIAPALFILPAVWLFYRPPLKLQPLLLAGVLVIGIWYPYLRFEHTRNFADIRSQLLRQRILPAQHKNSWCDPGLTLRNLEEPSGTLNFKPEQTLDAGENTWRKNLEILLVRWKLIEANFEGSVDNPGIRVALALLLLISLFVLSVFGTLSGLSEAAGRQRFGHRLTWIAVGMILAGVIANEFFIARYLSSRGILQPSTLSSIRWLQAVLIVSGITLLALRKKIVTIVNMLAAYVGVGIHNADRSDRSGDGRFFVLSLVIPWLILLLLVEPGNATRFWWLWSLQVIVLAALATYIPSRLQAPRMIAWVGSLLLIVTLLMNPWTLSRIGFWISDGWSGSDGDEIQAVDYVSSRLKGRNQTAVGYQVLFWRFSAEYNIVDPRYKVGADFDLLFADRHGVSNSNHCAEGVSPNDEFRIVQATRHWANPAGKSYFEIPLDRNFRLLQQFGPYQVFERADSARFSGRSGNA
jgi:hypothetical protein